MRANCAVGYLIMPLVGAACRRVLFALTSQPARIDNQTRRGNKTTAPGYLSLFGPNGFPWWSSRSAWGPCLSGSPRRHRRHLAGFRFLCQFVRLDWDFGPANACWPDFRAHQKPRSPVGASVSQNDLSIFGWPVVAGASEKSKWPIELCVVPSRAAWLGLGQSGREHPRQVRKSSGPRRQIRCRSPPAPPHTNAQSSLAAPQRRPNYGDDDRPIWSKSRGFSLWPHYSKVAFFSLLFAISSGPSLCCNSFAIAVRSGVAFGAAAAPKQMKQHRRRAQTHRTVCLSLSHKVRETTLLLVVSLFS